MVFVSLFVSINFACAQSSLPYLGQSAPDTIPVKFGPAYLQGDANWSIFSAPVFSPDGKEMFFAKYNRTNNTVKLFFVGDDNGTWTAPQTPGFASTFRTECPIYAFDGQKLYFRQDRVGNDDFKIYSLNRTPAGWASQQLINFPYQSLPGSVSNISMTLDSTFYYTLHTLQGAYIYRSKRINGQYLTFEKLPNPINSYNSSSPFIDPQERYLLFESERPGGRGSSDLYISYKKPDGSWNTPQNLGSIINGQNADACAWISPDGKYLFYLTKRTGDTQYNVYWLDAKVLDRFNPYSSSVTQLSLPDIPMHLYPNPCADRASLSFTLEQASTVTLQILSGSGVVVSSPITNQLSPAGVFQVDLNTHDLTPGLYYCVLRDGRAKAHTCKMLINR